MGGEKKRDAFVDIAKGIAMLLIVRIHTEVFGVIHAPYPIIAVPFFFFMSGFYDNTHKPVKEWFPKTFKSLVVTGVIWVLLSFAYLSMLHYIKDRTMPISFSIENPLIGGGVTWFLFALFYAKCGMWIIRKCKIPFYVAFPLSFLIASLSTNNLPFLLDEGLAALPFYYLGFILYPYIDRTKGGHIILAILGMICILLMPMKWFPYVLVPWVVNGPILMYPIYFGMTVLSFFPILWLTNRITKATWLANYGKQTLGILVLHPLMLHTCAVTLNRIFVPASGPWIISFLLAYVIVCVVSYYLSALIVKHCPILLGRK